MSRKLFAAALAAGVLWRVVLLARPEWVNGGEVDVYLADEGVVGLMAKHILEGTSRPVFFYGQHYLGALEGYLAAVSFAVFGIGLTALRAVPLVASLALLAAVYLFARETYSRTAARWATALVALAPMYFLQWNLKARGGFIEHVALLFLVMILAWRYLFAGRRQAGTALALGLVAGLAFWVNQLVLAYLLVLVPVLLLSRDQGPARWPLIAVGFALGASLLIGYNLVHPLATFRTLARKSVTLNRVPVAERDEHWLARGIGKRLEALSQGADKIGMVFGVPPRPAVAHLGLSENVRRGTALTHTRRAFAWIPLLVFGAVLLAFRPRRMQAGDKRRWHWREPDPLLFWFFLATFLVGYVSPRYMLPAYPIAAVIAGSCVARLGPSPQRWAAAALAAVMIYNVSSWVDLPAAAEADGTRRVRTLVETLEAHGLTRCYAAGPMYHAVFASGEKVILAPLQKDRYPPYAEAVGRADRICYVYRDDQTGKRQHRAFLSMLAAAQVRSRSLETGPYTVLYNFEPRDAITEAELERVRHQERAHVLPASPPSD